MKLTPEVKLSNAYYHANNIIRINLRPVIVYFLKSDFRNKPPFAYFHYMS